MQTDNPNAPDCDWQTDREWFNQRLANVRIHNSELERKIASQNEVIRQKSAQISRLQSTIKKLRDGSPEITSAEPK